MNEAKLSRLINHLSDRLGHRRLNIAILPLPGQPPGEHMKEHDRRIGKTFDVWICTALRNRDACRGVTILCSSGTADIDGLSCAQYMKRQLLAFCQGNVKAIEEFSEDIKIAEEVSAHTAGTIISSREHILNGGYDLVVLVSNWPHLLPAGVYFKHNIPQVPFIKCSSGAGVGTLKQFYPFYLLREFAHYLAAMTFDWWPYRGHKLDKKAEKLCREWRQKRYPPIPPPA